MTSTFMSLCKDVVLPEKPKLKFLNKVPNLKKVKKEMKRLRDIQGPARAANTFTTGQYAIVVSPRSTAAGGFQLFQLFRHSDRPSSLNAGHGRGLHPLGSHRNDASNDQPQNGFPNHVCPLAHQQPV